MQRISLIANSSIQYYKFSSNIDLEFGRNSRLYYHQPFDHSILSFTYSPLYRVITEGDESYYSRQELIDNKFIIESTNRLKEDADLTSCTKVPEDSVFAVTDIKTALKRFQKKWIPLPYFKNNNINKDLIFPTDWVRVYFECDESYSKVKIVLAVDTSLSKDETDKTSPQLSLNPNENIHTLNNNENLLSSFLFSKDTLTQWIEEYIADMFYGKNEEMRTEQPYKQYIGHYLMLVKWLHSLKSIPEIQLYSDEAKKIPVDLVVDVGNSATCALIFENQNDAGFDFSRVKKLLVQDYSNPFKQYQNPFPMNLIFKKASFGDVKEDKYHNNKFVVPSFVRIGYEAEELINQFSINLDLGREIKSYNSSPKRYLWDVSPAEVEWEFAPDKDKKVNRVELSGISEQLKSDGSLVTKGDVFGSKSLFSKSSLMKFVFLEALTHAYVQINSYEFRKEHGNLTTPRSLRRITISCPTAMIQYEQIALREAAVEACKLLNNYFSLYYDSMFDSKTWFEMPEIIPSIEDLKKNLDQLEDRKDWSYDEATSNQLVFLYSLLAKKLRGNNYVLKNYIFKNKEKLTIGSIDIGAGTSDVMIADYNLNAQNNSIELKPSPIYWDSFKLAGDDLMKQLIQNIVIQGKIENTSDDGCTGVIQNKLKDLGMNDADISNKLNGFFGQDSNKIALVGKLMRKAFIKQVATPIATYYLESANSDETEIKTFEEITETHFKNDELIKYFEKYFGFNFLELKWTIQSKKVEQIVNSVFDGMVKKLGVILNHYRCDYVVLSGRPSKLNSLESLFLKYLNIPKNNLINLNTYWIGKWYPFADERGFVEDSKTMVAVGSMISLMSNRLKKLEDLEFNTEVIKQKLISTADYIIKKDFDGTRVILSPSQDENTINIRHFPFSFGFARFNVKDYPISDLYNITNDFDEILRSSNGNEESANKKRNRLEQNIPIELTLSREYDVSKEKLKIDDVIDSDGNNYPTKYFKLEYQTLGDQHEYWLDNCEFTLGI